MTNAHISDLVSIPGDFASDKRLSENTFLGVLGEPVPRQKIIEILKEDMSLYEQFLTFPDYLKEEFLQFCEGTKGLKITYDPFFRKILNPREHPRRLEHFLQTILGQPLKIQEILSREGMQLVEKGSLVIMDILVSLADGSMVNVEMQKIGYSFPAERSECYASDMTMRQYTLVKEEKGKKFSFHDMKPVFLIVIMEESPAAFQTSTDDYLHKRLVSYDTGISLSSLHNILYINLDIFRENVHTITNDTEAWLTFLSSDAPSDILQLMEYNSIFQEMYHDMVEFRRDVREVVAMYSEALKIMDHNMELYMIDELKKEIDTLKSSLAQKDMENEQLRAKLASLENNK